MRTSRLLLAPLLLLGACSMTGDTGTPARLPDAALNMNANKIMQGNRSVTVAFHPNSDRMDDDASHWRELMADGISEITVYSPAYDTLRARRERAISRQLRGLGLRSDQIRFVSSPDRHTANTYRLDAVFAYAVPPACPNWNSLSAENPGNYPPANHGCSTVRNVGQMAADPRDIIQGSGNARPDAARNALVIEAYKTGMDWGKAGTSYSASGSSGSSESGSSGSEGGGSSGSTPQ